MFLVRLCLKFGYPKPLSAVSANIGILVLMSLSTASFKTAFLISFLPKSMKTFDLSSLIKDFKESRTLEKSSLIKIYFEKQNQ